MERIPLAQRLGAPDAGKLIGQLARLSCNDYFQALHGLIGSANYTDDIKLSEGWQLAVWLSCLEKVFPDMAPNGRNSLLYRYVVAPFTKLDRKGENAKYEQ